MSENKRRTIKGLLIHFLLFICQLLHSKVLEPMFKYCDKKYFINKEFIFDHQWIFLINNWKMTKLSLISHMWCESDIEHHDTCKIESFTTFSMPWVVCTVSKQLKTWWFDFVHLRIDALLTSVLGGSQIDSSPPPWRLSNPMVLNIVVGEKSPM